MWFNQFKNDPIQQKYEFVKNKFLEQLNNTATHCENYYLKKYDQERNYSISANPEIDSRIKYNQLNKKNIESEVDRIERIFKDNPLVCLKHLISYGQSLMTEDSKSTFMQVLKGKLKKYWQKEIKTITDILSDLTEHKDESILAN